jgi:gliding motility-associated-like protein
VYDKADASILTSGPFCSNDEALQFEAVTSGGTWSGNGIKSSGWFTPAFAQAGLHTIIYTIGGYCGDSDTVQVIVNEAPKYTIVKQDETCYPANDGAIQIVVSDPSYLIMWNTGSTSFELDNLHPGKYTFEIVDANNCKVSDNVIIDQSFDDCHPSHFYVPNIFSPNGDGENDQLCVRGYGITSLEFVVYNRWGNKVFETTTLDTCWDGKYQGTFAEAGVYAYVIKIVYKDKSRIEKHGTVTLVR